MLNRPAIVARHNPTLHALNPLSPLSVGNGNFAFTADVTGLQTFPAPYEDGMSLHTQSVWGWHSTPNLNGYKYEDTLETYDVHGRPVPYASGQTPDGSYNPASDWLRANPHRLDLGRLGLILRHENGTTASPEELTEIEQTLHLWQGRLESRFTFSGTPVRVTTVCHPELDLIGVRIESDLPVNQLGLRLAFPYGREDWKRAADWDNQTAHTTHAHAEGSSCDFHRRLDADQYFARLTWSGHGRLTSTGPHTFEFHPIGQSALEFTLAFSPEPLAQELPDFQAIQKASEEHWENFWTTGGAIDLSESTDPRWQELERRVVLSQYLTALNCSGSAPPQETGLVCNSWYGKPHLEMHWWHAAHFPLWGRTELLENSLGWYQEILPLAQEHARRQGYPGARWPKMVDGAGHDSPSSVGVFLIWQQPHPIYFAELCYRAQPNSSKLEQFGTIVAESATFMAEYATYVAESNHYVLGPALIPAQESYGHQRATNLNPTYELAYWHWALGIAQQWRERAGLERDPKWDHVRDHLAKPPIRDGIYDAIETPPHLIRHDHPSMLGAYGFVPPTPLIDPEIMLRTLESVLEDWDWPTTWGWDYPLIAFTAARLGRPDLALDALFLDSPKNVYLPNGHNYQAPRLPLYLPGNGGLLAAIAMMVGGWDGAPEINAPGFPQDGSWVIHHEGLQRMP